MEKIIHICDICKKEVDKYIIVEILIGGERRYNYSEISLKNQDRSLLLICDNCIGSEIERYNEKKNIGKLYIKDKGINLLKKLRIIK